jgi:hypothetical protein
MSPRGFLRARADRALITETTVNGSCFSLPGKLDLVDCPRLREEAPHRPFSPALVRPLLQPKIDWVPSPHAQHQTQGPTLSARLAAPTPSNQSRTCRAESCARADRARFRGINNGYDMRRPATCSTIRKITRQKTAGVAGKKSAEVDAKNCKPFFAKGGSGKPCRLPRPEGLERKPMMILGCCRSILMSGDAWERDGASTLVTPRKAERRMFTGSRRQIVAARE